MIWLGIDTSNVALSVAVMEDQRILAEITQTEKLSHSIGAMPAIEKVMQQANVLPQQLNAIAVSEGPGSYTGVRIGVTLAKTLAWSLKIPVVGVSSMEVLVENGKLLEKTTCAIVDARRGNAFVAMKNASGEILIETGYYEVAELVSKCLPYNEPIVFLGENVETHWETIQSILGEQAIRADVALDAPKASNVILLAQQKTLPSSEETHMFVPQYKRITEAEANLKKAAHSNE